MIHLGDCLEVLRTLPPESVQCCVTSPPYWGLRDYGTARWEGGDAGCDHRKKDSTSAARKSTLGPDRNGLGPENQAHAADVPFRDVCGKCGARRVDSQLGLERTPEEYVARLVAVFGEVRRVLRDDGVLWLNLGDSYASTGRSDQSKSPKGTNGQILGKSGREVIWSNDRNENFSWTLPGGIKPKDLVGIPWRVAFALQAGGWYLRQDIIWAKPNPMPESVTDRCTKAHEYIFMLTKSARYFYDAEAMKEPAKVGDCGSSFTKGKTGNKNLTPVGAQERVDDGFRNRRSVWTITTRPYSEAHFATFPPEIPEICIRASSKPGDTVLDPFAGSCTVGWVAKALNREFIGIELNPEYVAMGKRRMKEPWQHGEKELGDDMPLFAEACP